MKKYLPLVVLVALSACGHPGPRTVLSTSPPVPVPSTTTSSTIRSTPTTIEVAPVVEAPVETTTTTTSVPEAPAPEPVTVECNPTRPGSLCPGDGPLPANVIHSDYYNRTESGTYCPPNGASWDATIWATAVSWPDQWPISGVDCDPSLPIVVVDSPGGP